MALPTRHLKIGSCGAHVLRELKWSKGGYGEYLDVTGLFNFVLRGMRISYDYIVEESCGKQLPNGTWTGIFGLLNRSEVDYAPAMLTVTEEGWDAAAFNYPYASDELVFVTRKPEYSPETMALFRTLSPNVWLSLLAGIVLVTLACFVAMKRRCTLGDILLHVLAISLNQEGNLVPKRAGEVLLLCTWTVAMAVFTLCFKSVLLSFLSFPPTGGVRTVPELAAAIRAGQYIAFTYPSNDFPSRLRNSPNEDFRVIGENMLKNPRGTMIGLLDENPKYPLKALVYRRSYVSFADGMLYVSKDNMGIFNLATAVNKDFCCKDEMDMLVHRFLAAGINLKIDRHRNYLYALDLATAVNKDFCCKDEMDMLVHRFLAAGINLKIDRHRNYLYALDLASEVPQDGENTIREITMTDLSGAFILLVAGHCLSVCVLIVECCVKRRKRRHSSTRTIDSGTRIIRRFLSVP